MPPVAAHVGAIPIAAVVVGCGGIPEQPAVTPSRLSCATDPSSFDLAGRPVGGLSLPAIGTAEVNAAQNGTEAFVRLRSFVVPSQVLRVVLLGRGAFDRGGVCGHANLRGGSEFGEAWHRAGMLDRKQNVLDDMAAVAQDVVSRRIASPQRLAVMGASDGGLLAAAMVVHQPSLFPVAVARVPLTDMLRYQDFLLGRLWMPEYGSSADAHMFLVLLAYSPYHNVKSGVRYPDVLLTAADSDGRVDPMHTCKLAAALQRATASDAPVLPRVETRAGHGSGKAIGKQVGEYADMFGFVMSELGMLETPAGGADAAQPR